MQKTSAIYSTVNGVTTRVQAVADGIFRVTHTRRPDFLTERGETLALARKKTAEDFFSALKKEVGME